jgi:ADP-L-glycero-D-manno-heptose 6-epimerase
MLVVTGGGGFIGSVVVALLNAAGYEDIVIVDNFGTSDKWRNIAKRDFADIVPVQGLLRWLTRFGPEVEAVFHLGANSSTTAADADDVIASNLNTSIELWRWCTHQKIKLIYVSSAATYGDGANGFDDNADISALKRLSPLNLYGWTKHAFDLWAVREAARGRSPPLWIGLKPFSVFGPNEYHKGDMMSLVAQNYRKILAGEPIRLFKSDRPDMPDGGHRRDFIYVKDCAAVMVWLLRHGCKSGIFNLGTGKAHSFRELVDVLGSACAVLPLIQYVEVPAAIRPHLQYFTEAPIGKLRAAGYVAPFCSLETAVHDYVAGYLAKPDPYL